MRKLLVALSLAAAISGAVFVYHPVLSPASADTRHSAEDAIALALQHSIFAAGLEFREGWTAQAYNSENAYGIWRVQFWHEGDDLGWADVSLDLGKVYGYEAYFGATDLQREAAEEVIRDFVSSNEEVLELLPDVADYEMYIDYDSSSKLWYAYVDRGSDSIMPVIQFAGDDPLTPEDPALFTIWFPQIVSYTEWEEAQKANAISIAFQQSDISAALRGADWVTEVSTVDGQHVWHVLFLVDGTGVADATVNLNTSAVTEYSVYN
jgi:hypothetical protein